MSKGNPVIVANPSNGNQPFIQICDIANRVASLTGIEFDVVVPEFYPGTQREIMGYRSGRHDNVYLSRELGELLVQTMIDSNGYSNFLDRFTAHAGEVERRYQECLKAPIKALSLTGKEKTLSPKDIQFDVSAWMQLDTGLRAYETGSFIFPQILDYAIAEGGHGFDVEKLKQARDFSKDNKRFKKIFLSSVHQLGFDNNRVPYANEVYTPPQKEPSPEDKTDMPPFIYLNVPGNSFGRDKILEKYKEFTSQGLEVVFSTNLKDPSYRTSKPSIINNKNCRGVVGRSGMGTLWEAQLAKKPFIPLVLENDDPEITFILRTINGIDLVKETEEVERKFGTLNGIDYVARQIIKEEGL